MTDEVKPVTAIVPAANVTALAVPPELAAKLAKLPLSIQQKAINRPKPSMEQFLTTLNTIPSGLAEREGFQTLLERTNSDKEGLEAGASRTTFRPRTIKIEQGIGNDPVKPPDLPKGTMYDSQGYVVPNKSKMVVLLMTRPRALWPPKNDDENTSNRPLCSSPDGSRGTVHGDCGKCSFALKKANEGGCARTVVAYFLSEDASVIYRVIFSKTSYLAGDQAYKMVADSPNPWEFYWSLDTQSQTGGTGQKKNTWFTFRMSRALDADKKVMKTKTELKEVYSAFSRLLWHEMFLNDMLYTYAKDASDVAPVVTEDSLAAMTDKDGNPIKAASENPSFDSDV